MAIKRNKIIISHDDLSRIKETLHEETQNAEDLDALAQQLKADDSDGTPLRDLFRDKDLILSIKALKDKGVKWTALAKHFSGKIGTEINIHTFRSYYSFGLAVNNIPAKAKTKKSPARKKTTPSSSEVSSTGDSQVMKSPAPVRSEEPEQPVEVVEPRPEESVSKPVIAEKAIIEQEKTEEAPVVVSVTDEPVVQENKVEGEGESGAFVPKMPEPTQARASKIARMRGR